MPASETGPAAAGCGLADWRHLAGLWRVPGDSSWLSGQFRRSDAGMSLGAEERRLLAQIPLHAITSLHGEPGLRERLAIEIARLAPADRDRVQQALALA